MKKQITKFALIAAVMLPLVFAGCSKDTAETPEEKPKDEVPPKDEFLAPTTPQNATALLEDFTGVRCGFCPDGHVKAKAVADANPGKFVVIAVHAGPYAVPATGWANFTTPFGQALVNQSGVTGYPSGTMNRMKAADLGGVPQTTGGLSMSRGYWSKTAGAVMAMSTPVNIGAEAKFNSTTRELTVKVDLYYTGDEVDPNNINVALLQDHLMSRQSGAPDPNNYEQNHVLRHLLTGQWGDVVSEAKTMGSKVSKTYTYTVPEDYNGTNTEGGGAVVIDNLKVVVFVSRGPKHVLHAIEVDVE